MPDIFLSYTREDQATAQRFAEAFEAQAWSVWWDATLRSGEAYDQVTEEALRTAKAVVVLWSKKSVTSRWVRAEATLADRNRTLAPALIEPCERPIMFELTQTADLSRWTGDVKDPAWRGFLADVRRFVEAASPPARPGPAPASVPKPNGRRPSIAVLPFSNRSGLSEDDSFAEAMVEDLTAALSDSYWTKVVASSATSAYRTGARDLRQIGRDLGVRFLVEGAIRRSGDDLRLTTQLVDAETGNILWTRRFDRPLAELSRLQDDLVVEIAAHLRVELQRAGVELALMKPEATSVLEAMYRNSAHAINPTLVAREKAVAEAKRAVDLNPDDGVAYANLASWQGHLLHFRGGDDPELAQEIVDNIGRARALDPANPEVLYGVSVGLAWMRKPQEALPFVERAVAMKPNHENGRLSLGMILAMLGRSDEAIAELDAVDRLAPNGIFAHLTWRWRSTALLQAGRYDQALEAADRAVRVLPGPETLIQRLLCLAVLGEEDRARDALRHLRAADPELSRALAEGLIRDAYCGSHAVDDYVATVRRIWDQASSEADAP
jgi:TolB-like protein/Flp pilus assembly protein TadD